MPKLFVLTVFLFLIVLESFAQTTEPHLEEMIKLPKLPFQIKDYGGTMWWQSDFVSNDSARYLRLRFAEVKNPNSEAINIVIRDKQGIELARVDTRILVPDQPWISPLLMTNSVRASIESSKRPKGFSLVLSSYFFSKSDPRQLSVPNTPDPWKSISTISQNSAEIKWAQSVVNIISTDTNQSCTGFIVGSDLIMTNEHCAELSERFRKNRKSCNDLQIQLDFNAESSTRVYAGCAEAVSGKGIDVAVLKVRAADRDKLKNRPILKLATAMKHPLEVEVIHHPAGLSKMISPPCKLLDFDAGKKLLRHDCNTIPGSSGSPIFDMATGVVAALQVQGYPNMSKPEYDLRSARGEKFYNFAVPAAQIRKLFTDLTD